MWFIGEYVVYWWRVCGLLVKSMWFIGGEYVVY